MSVEKIAQEWHKMMKPRFAALERDTGDIKITDDNVKVDWTNAEFDDAVLGMKNKKATPAHDQAPAELFKHSKEARKMLRNLCREIWDGEFVPGDMILGELVMLHKKGDKNDLWNYRPVCLLSHALKILSRLMLTKLAPYVEAHVADWQAGFRSERGCRDGTMTTGTVINNAIREGKRVACCFIDFADAFSSISHNYLIIALARAKVPAKLQRLVLATYKQAAARVRIDQLNGETVFSPQFQIDRGVVQGDIMSPALFIVGLQSMLLQADEHWANSAGVKMPNSNDTLVSMQGYADDLATWAETADMPGWRGRLCKETSERISALAAVGWAAAGMRVKCAKTKVMFIETRGHRTASERRVQVAAGSFGTNCECCGRKFPNQKSLPSHKSNRRYGCPDILRLEEGGTNQVEKILDMHICRDPKYDVESRFFQVQFKGESCQMWVREHVLIGDTNKKIKAQVGKKVIPMLETFLKHFKAPNRPTI